MKEELVSITMVDHATSQMTIFSSKHDELSPVIIIMPAMGALASYYRELAMEITKIGWNAVTTDLRGHGYFKLRASRQNNYGYHEMVNYDWSAIVMKVKSHFPSNRIYFLGHSLGGQLSALYLSQNLDIDIDGLILVASCSVYFKGWQGISVKIGMLISTQLAYLVSLLFGYFPGNRLGFAGREARNVIRDWSRNARSGKYILTNSSFDFEANLKLIKCPVLAISFANDIYSPKRAVNNLLHKMKQAPHTHWHFNAKMLDLKKLSHFSWAKTPMPIVKKIKKWIETS